MNQHGRVWRVGADIDTDALAPGAYMKFGIDEIARHCLQRVRPDFAAGVRPGDVLVAGPNFGIGSSREQAAAALVRLGVAAVVAPSYNGLYFRNAFNVGLLLLTCPHAARLVEGERVSLDGRRPHPSPGRRGAGLRAAAGLPAGHGAGRRPAQSTEGAAKGARPQAGQAPGNATES